MLLREEAPQLKSFKVELQLVLLSRQWLRGGSGGRLFLFLSLLPIIPIYNHPHPIVVISIVTTVNVVLSSIIIKVVIIVLHLQKGRWILLLVMHDGEILTLATPPLLFISHIAMEISQSHNHNLTIKTSHCNHPLLFISHIVVSIISVC